MKDRFVRRSATGDYSALWPEITADGERLQRALLGDREAYVAGAVVSVGVAIAVILAVAVFVL
jgi:hypothetical protein